VGKIPNHVASSHEGAEIMTKWDIMKLAEIKQQMIVLGQTKESDLTADHIAEAQYLAYTAKYFADKAKKCATARSIQ
jgi:hypothetical protein